MGAGCHVPRCSHYCCSAVRILRWQAGSRSLMTERLPLLCRSPSESSSESRSRSRSPTPGREEKITFITSFGGSDEEAAAAAAAAAASGAATGKPPAPPQPGGPAPGRNANARSVTLTLLALRPGHSPGCRGGAWDRGR